MTNSESTQFVSHSSRVVKSLMHLFQGSTRYLQSQKEPNFVSNLLGRCEVGYTSSRAVRSLSKLRKYPGSLPLFQGGAKHDIPLSGQCKVFIKTESSQFVFHASRVVRSMIHLFQGSAQDDGKHDVPLLGQCEVLQRQKVPNFCTSLPGRCEA